MLFKVAYYDDENLIERFIDKDSVNDVVRFLIKKYNLKGLSSIDYYEDGGDYYYTDDFFVDHHFFIDKAEQMYIQITTRCNMKCPHCCFNCNTKGQDMSFEIFKLAVKLDSIISIGGGEPTLHKEFEKFLLYAIGKSEYVWLATNGSQTEISISLAEMAKKGIIGCALSLDNFHDKIDGKVISVFEKLYAGSDNDNREIKTVNIPFNAGRAKKKYYQNKYMFEVKEGCCCPDIIIKPNGDVRLCGCDDSPIIGNVLNNFHIPDDYEFGECWKNQLNIK